MYKADRVLMAALAISLLANLGLVFLWRHSSSLTKTYTASHLDAQALPRTGARLNELDLRGLDGKKLEYKIGSNELPIVAYVLSPACKWCKVNQPNIDSLATQMQGKYRFIGVSITSQDLASYVSENAPPFPVYYLDSKSPHPSFELKETPETLVFSPNGTFVQGWSGAYIDETKRAVSSYFSVKFPG